MSLSGGLLPVLPIGLAAALALATPPPAPANDSIPIRVEFDAPAGCSSVDAFYAGLLTRMGRARRAAPGDAALHLGVRLTRVGTKVRGELRMMDGPGDGDTRRVDGESCDAVVEVLSLTAALALVGQPQRATPPPPPPPPPRPRSSASSSRTLDGAFRRDAQAGIDASHRNAATAASTAGRRKDARDRRSLRRRRPKRSAPGFRSVYKLLPRTSSRTPPTWVVGSACASNATRTTVRADPSALTFLYASNDLLQNPDEISLQWTALAVTGCPPFSLGRILTLEACAQGIGGWLSATGRGISNPSSARRSWWSVGALLRIGAHLGGGLALELEAGATIPIVERRFYIDTMDTTVGQTPTIAPVIALGLSLAL